MSRVDLSLDVAVLGIVIAASTNTLVKAGLALIVGGKNMLLRFSAPVYEC